MGPSRMRTPFSMCALLAALIPCPAHSLPPSPIHSHVGISEPGAPCQFRFHSNGSLDALVLTVTLRDAFSTPQADCEVSATLLPNETSEVCSCHNLGTHGFTDARGALKFEFSELGGRGSLDLAVSVHCAGDWELSRIPIMYTSADLDASCAAAAVDVVDLGLWASGLPPDYRTESDYNCDGMVNILDLGIWAGGLGAGCDE